MPTFTTYEPGCPCWIDLMSPDTAASEAFYRAVFGWESEALFDNEGNQIYTQFRRAGQVVAGMGGQMAGMENMPPIWNTYICVEDVAATAAKVEQAGGSVLAPPMQVMDAGNMAVLADPTGAAFSVWQPNQHKGADVANEPDTWSWNELLTRNVDPALAFYRDVFGWEYDDQDMPNGTYHVIKGGQHGGWGGVMAMPPGIPDMVPNHWMVYFTVSDVDATVEAVKANGGMVGQEPMDIPEVGRLAVIHDPQGGVFSIMQPVPAAAA